MAGACVWPRCFVDRQSIMNMVPIFGCCVGRIDAERLDTIDQLQNPFDLRPAGQPQQTLGQPDSRSRLSPPGVIQGTVE